MRIVLVHGKPRSGKTFLIFFLCYRRAVRGERILSNFTFQHENASEITPYGMIKLLDGGRVGFGRSLCLQEIYGWLSSYRGMSDVSIAEAGTVFQSGKLGINIFGDSQLVGRVDSCVKDMADARFEAVSKALCNKEKCVGSGCKNIKLCHFRYYRLDLRFRDRNVRLARSPLRIPFSVACRYWDLYDTYSVTKPIGWDDLMVKSEKMDSGLLISRVDSQVKLIKERGMGLVGKRVTKVGVEYALLKLGESGAFAGLVAHALMLQS